jgi:hypothetical protein
MLTAGGNGEEEEERNCENSMTCGGETEEDHAITPGA